MKKIFKNRITQETPNTIKQLKSLWIDMSSDKQLAPNTPNGLFAFTLNPNNFVDAVKLETDFKSILSHYYHWRYGSKWRKLKHIQVPFQGIIEKQSNGINHIHITIYQYNVEELALFIGYIIKMFKSLYFKASYTGVGCIHYGQIYTYYGTFAERTKSYVSNELAEKLKKAQTGDLIIATTSENVEDVGKAVAWLGDENICISGDAFIYHHNQNPKYMSYLFQTNSFFEQKKKCITGVKVMRINDVAMSKFKFGFPPIEEQERIVAILDKFDSLVNDISEGLPAELTARRQQYEYYRNKLLTFEEAV